MATTLLGLALLTGGARAQQRDNQAAPAKPPAGEVVATVGEGQKPDAAALREAEARRLLLAAAIEDYLQKQPSAFSDTEYGRELKALQDRFTDFIRSTDTSLHNQVVFIDPEKVAQGEALGLPRLDAVRMILAAHGVVPDSYQAGVMNHLQAMLPAKFNHAAKGTDGVAFVNYWNTLAEPAVLVPASDHAIPHPIAGFTPLLEKKFIDLHEGWHAIDARYHYRGLWKSHTDLAESGDFAKMAADENALKAFSIRYRKEAFADLGALGDMIREGHSPAVIDTIIDWRKRGFEDVMHRSAPVLEAFRAKIADMGLENFRKLPQEQARDLYYSLADTHGMSAESLAVGIRLLTATPAERAAIQAEARTKPETAKALAFEPHMRPRNLADDGETTQPLTEEEKRALKELEGWSPSAELRRKALETAGRITPATMLDAYEALHDGLRAKMKADPANPLYPMQMTRLLGTVMTEASRMDYIAANAAAGVDIVAADPALQSLRGGAKPAPKPPSSPSAPKPGS